MQLIAIIDYGMGNLHSVKKAAIAVAKNAEVIITSDLKQIQDSDKIIFPGQGAAKECMQAIKKNNLQKTILEAANEKPFLGICMGAHVLFSHSTENGGVECLDFLAGKDKNLRDLLGEKAKVPHMGWNSIKQTHEHPLWHGIEDNSYFYFAHSYFMHPTNQDIICGTTDYMDVIFCTAIAYKQVFAIQAHPEKSSYQGLQLLRNFVKL